jgi:regulator of protease activity HflC (stomatin/prohibitin superfamily)
MKKIRNIVGAVAVVAAAMIFQQCAVIRPGEVGLKQKLGRLKPGSLTGGAKWFDPFITKVIKISTQVQEYSATLHLPTKDGLEVNTELSLFYHIQGDSARSFYKRFGRHYSNNVVISILNAEARAVCAEYDAQELIGEREQLEQKIMEKLEEEITPFGYMADKFVLRDIDMPDEIANAIKNKVTAQQVALQSQIELDKQRKEYQFDLEKEGAEADFAIEKQKKESERMKLEARAIKNYQDTVNSSITDKYIQYKSLDVTRDLISSPNSKVIILDGKTVGIKNELEEK